MQPRRLRSRSRISALIVICVLIFGMHGILPTAQVTAQGSTSMLVYNADSRPAIAQGSSQRLFFSGINGILMRTLEDNGTLGEIFSIAAETDTPIVAVGDAGFWLTGGYGNWRVQGLDLARGITFDGVVAYGGGNAFLDVVELPAFELYAVLVGSEAAGAPRLELYSYAAGYGDYRNPYAMFDASMQPWLDTQSVSIATDGSNLFAVFGVSADGSQYNVYGSLFNAYGGAIRTDIALGSSGIFSDEDPEVISDDAGYLVAWAHRAGNATDPCSAASIPASADSDGDGMPNAWEGHYGLPPNYFDAQFDIDGDGLTNVAEWYAGTDPTQVDTDRDGLWDAEDPYPTQVDGDRDGLRDGQEVLVYGTNPQQRDSDGDGWSDLDEIGFGYDPNDATSPPAGTSPIRDYDDDGMDDAWEMVYGLDPNNSGDAGLDPDGDGLINRDEALRSRIDRRDSDGDGVGDYDELNLYCSSPMNFDTDGDGFSDGQELGAVMSQLLLQRVGYDGVPYGAPINLHDSQQHIEWPRFGYDALTGETALVWFERDGYTRNDNQKGDVFLLTLSGTSPSSAPTVISGARNIAASVLAPSHAIIARDGQYHILINRDDGLFLFQRGTVAATPVPTSTPTFVPTGTPLLTPVLPSATAAAGTATAAATATPGVIDAFEPDGFYPIIPIGIPHLRTFDPAGDEDFVSFHVKAGYTYLITTVSQAPVDPRIEVTLPNASLFYSDDDGGPGTDVRLLFEVLGDDEALVNIFSVNSQYGPEMAYQLLIQEFEPQIEPTATPYPNDAYEPDDTVEQASCILAGETQARSIAPGDDLDFVCLHLKQGTTYRIHAQRQDSLVDLFLDLDIGLYNDDCPDYGMAATCLEFVSSIGGDRLLKVGAVAGGGAYILSFSSIIPTPTPSPQPTTTSTEPPPPADTTTPTPTRTLTPTPSSTSTPSATSTATAQPFDAYEYDDVSALASLLVEGAPQQHTFWNASGDDADYVRVRIKPGQSEIAARSFTANYDPKLTVEFAGQTYIGDDSEEGKNAIVIIDAVIEGFAMVRVDNLGIDGPGSYTLSLRKLSGDATATILPGREDAYEPDEPPDPPAPYAGEQMRTFNPEGDIDIARYLLKAGVETYFTTRGCSGGADTEISVFDDGGILLGRNDDAPGLVLCSHVSLKVSADTWVNVKVRNRGQAWGANVAYRLRIATDAEITPTPTVTPTSTSVLLATPTQAPPFPTPRPSFPTPRPTPRPYSSPIPRDTLKPPPSRTPRPTSTRIPTRTPVPTRTSLPSGSATPSTSTTPGAVPGTAELRVEVLVFIDENNDKLASAGEGVSGLLAVVRVGKTSWTGYTNDGTATIRIPPQAPGTEVRVDLPYLHRASSFTVSESDEIPVEVVLLPPELPVFIP